MPNYRRCFVPGGTYFFTVVTANRAPIFGAETACRILGDCLRIEREKRPYRTEAIVVLPDHLHAVWSLPAGDANYSIRWAAVKSSFTRRWIEAGGDEQVVSAGMRGKRNRGVWQSRFLEHAVQDEDDFEIHVEYIHFNPVKHGHVGSPREWKWSSFHRHVQNGWHPREWGNSREAPPPSLNRVRDDLLE